MYSAGIMSFDYIKLTCASSIEGCSHSGTCKAASACVRIGYKPAPVGGPANKKPILTAANETDSGYFAFRLVQSANCLSAICPNVELELWSVPGRRQCCTLSLRRNRLGLNYWRESFLFAHGRLPARGTRHQICVCMSVCFGRDSISLDWIRATV